jgi:hypothetical protein
MSSFIYNLDLYGTKLQFTSFGEKKYHTVLGLILSLLSYAIFVIFIILFGNDFFYKLNPKIITEVLRPDKYYEKVIDQQQFTYAWRIFDNIPITFNHAGILYPMVEYFRFKADEKKALKRIYYERLPLEKCNENNVYDEKFKKEIKLNDWYCIDFKKYNMSLGGFLDGDFINYFKVKILYCENDITKGANKNCTSLEDLKKVLLLKNRLFFGSYYPDFYLDPNNVTHPLKYQYVTTFNQLTANIIKKDRVFLKEVYMYDDQDLIQQSYTISNITAMGSIQTDLSLKFDADYQDLSLSTEIYGHAVYFHKNGEKYSRSYTQIQDLAARVGGSMSLVIILGKILVSNYNSYSITKTLTNKFFDFTEPDLNKDDLAKAVNGEDNLSKYDNNKMEIITFKNKDSNQNQNNQNNQKKTMEDPNLRNKENEEKQVELTDGVNISQDRKSISQTITSLKQNQSGARSFNALKKRKTTTEMSSDKLVKYKDKLKEFNSIPKNPINHNFCLYIRGLLCGKVLSNEDLKWHNLYKHSKTYIDDKLEITNYLKMSSGIDRLRIFMYNEGQNLSFVHAKKPNLMDEEECDLFGINQNCKNDKQKEEYKIETQLKIIKYFSNKLKTETFSDYDEKLWEFLDPKFKKIISEIESLEHF